jgi:Na+/proline symporter
MATLFFFTSRVLASGYRLLACCVALAVIMGWSLEWVVVGTVIVVLAYTTFGGIKAVMYTDTIQATLILGAPMVCVVMLIGRLGQPVDALWQAAADAGKLRVFNFTASLTDETFFWLIAAQAFFQTLAAIGTDQDMTQRLLTCPDVRKAQRSTIGNALIGLPLVCGFLTVGVLLFLYYRQFVDASLPNANDKVFAHFIATAIPAGMKGLIIAALLSASMGSLDSASQSLATSAVVDLVRPFRRRARSDRHDLWLARGFVVFFCVLLGGLAIYFGQREDFQKLIYNAFAITSVVLGPMLGVFLLAVSTERRGHDLVNVFAMAAAVALVLCIRQFVPQIIWPWWIMIGTGATYVFAAVGRTQKPPA